MSVAVGRKLLQWLRGFAPPDPKTTHARTYALNPLSPFRSLAESRWQIPSDFLAKPCLSFRWKLRGLTVCRARSDVSAREYRISLSETVIRVAPDSSARSTPAAPVVG